MIISDLSHFELVETTSILGGNKQPSLQIASATLQGISSQLSSPVKTESLVTTGNQDASATIGSFTTKFQGKTVEGIITVSSANS